MPWLVSSVEAALLALLVFGDPARLTQQRRRVRPFAVTLVVLLVAAALWATVLLGGRAHLAVDHAPCAIETGAAYRIVVRGELDSRFAYLFGGMQMERVEGATVLIGRVIDQAQLHGYIERFGELRLELLTVEQTDEPS